MNSARATLAGIAVAASLVGCATAPPFVSSTDVLADMAGRNLAARQLCTDLLNRDRISAEEGLSCLRTTDTVKAVIESMRNGTGGDFGSARAALLELERVLQEASR